jgi:hypothetical protein
MTSDSRDECEAELIQNWEYPFFVRVTVASPVGLYNPKDTDTTKQDNVHKDNFQNTRHITYRIVTLKPVWTFTS